MSKNAKIGSPELPERAAEPGGPGFEKALAELEKIVAQMEGGNLPLEQALAAHKRGLELARYCRDKLDAAQQQVKVLEGDVLKPFPNRPDTRAEDELE
jgi:exodeoxyribonuclease VII small subunit